MPAGIGVMQIARQNKITLPYTIDLAGGLHPFTANIHNNINTNSYGGIGYIDGTIIIKFKMQGDTIFLPIGTLVIGPGTSASGNVQSFFMTFTFPKPGTYDVVGTYSGNQLFNIVTSATVTVIF